MIAAFALAQCSIVVKLALSAVTRVVFVEINVLKNLLVQFFFHKK